MQQKSQIQYRMISLTFTYLLTLYNCVETSSFPPICNYYLNYHKKFNILSSHVRLVKTVKPVFIEKFDRFATPNFSHFFLHRNYHQKVTASHKAFTISNICIFKKIFVWFLSQKLKKKHSFVLLHFSGVFRPMLTKQRKTVHINSIYVINRYI